MGFIHLPVRRTRIPCWPRQRVDHVRAGEVDGQRAGRRIGRHQSRRPAAEPVDTRQRSPLRPRPPRLALASTGSSSAAVVTAWLRTVAALGADAHLDEHVTTVQRPRAPGSVSVAHQRRVRRRRRRRRCAAGPGRMKIVGIVWARRPVRNVEDVRGTATCCARVTVAEWVCRGAPADAVVVNVTADARASKW